MAAIPAVPVGGGYPLSIHYRCCRIQIPLMRPDAWRTGVTICRFIACDDYHNVQLVERNISIAICIKGREIHIGIRCQDRIACDLLIGRFKVSSSIGMIVGQCEPADHAIIDCPKVSSAGARVKFP